MGRCRYTSDRGFQLGVPFIFTAVACSVFPQPAMAQAPGQLRYGPHQFACIVVRQTVSSEVTTLRGDVHRVETAGWNGELVLYGRPDTAASLLVTAWFQQLAVWRDTPEGRWDPSGEGMLGGRYRGYLDSLGTFQRTVTPFVPDAVKTVAALETALDELLPPVPAELPEVGGVVSDPRGWEFYRLSDTTWTGAEALRFRVVRTDTTTLQVEWADGLITEGQSVEEERGRLVWGRVVGPLRWSRRIRTAVTFPETAVSREEVTTEVTQDRLFEWVQGLPAERCPTP